MSRYNCKTGRKGNARFQIRRRVPVALSASKRHLAVRWASPQQISQSVNASRKANTQGPMPAKLSAATRTNLFKPVHTCGGAVLTNSGMDTADSTYAKTK